MFFHRFFIIFLFLLFCLSPFSAFAGQVIGQSTLFSILPSVFLVAGSPDEVAGVQVFNYFFTLELLVGFHAVFFRSILRVIPGF